ncbi:WD40 repeat domain-containing protein [Alkalinema sp. FACHB-956]|uniref:WD40 repeat domain-containing protein n=1 Tax=Alkalinema sp. FACHB-956 TaxID=2692768 RepID=UPI0016846B27|nr:WD40 repeat domain-containing protein [Alkalinema sp. FACHB-956]MBD2326446.1 WD40 repeat domain-containing protein [Alkalinema sp. FACHB-956]
MQAPILSSPAAAYIRPDSVCPLYISPSQTPLKLTGLISPNLAFSPDSQVLAATDESGNHGLKLLNLKTGDPQQVVPTGWLGSISFSPDSQRIATGSRGPMVALVDRQTPQSVTRFEGHKRAVGNVAFSPDGQYIASSSRDNTVRVWNLQGKSIAMLQGFPEIPHVDLSGVNAIGIVTWSSSQNVLVTIAASQRLERRLDLLQIPNANSNVKPITIDLPSEAADRSVPPFTVSSDGKHIAILSKNGMELWNLQGQLIARWPIHPGAVIDLDFSPDGQKIVTTTEDKAVKIWSLQGQLLSTFTGYKKQVKHVKFSPDGKCLLTMGEEDRTIRGWDLSTQEELFRLPTDGFEITLSPNGRYLATTEDDVVENSTTILVWQLQAQAQ